MAHKKKKKKKNSVYTNLGQRAVDLVEQGEKIIRSTANNVDWGEFGHLLLTWIISASIIFIVLLILECVNDPKDLFTEVILRTDTLSLMFSLVLSAGLDQVWNNKKNWKYKLTLCGEITLSFVGLILYLSYSLIEILDKENPYLQTQSRLWIHSSYIIISTIVVICGFYVRARLDGEG